jgi:mannose-6-phosphate isomerase-like protein (cupin superfamily)
MATRNSLLRVLGIPTPTEGGVARLEQSLTELKRDVDAALHAFVTKNRPSKESFDSLDAPRGSGRRLSAVGSPPASLSADPSAAAPASFDPSATYVCLAPSGDASTIEVTPEFWATIGSRADLADGRLVAAFESDEDWSHWEMHPHGEEVLVLLSGRMAFVLEAPGGEAGETRVDLLEGRAFVVPRGVWHRAIVEMPSKLLSISYGRGTRHRPH